MLVTFIVALLVIRLLYIANMHVPYVLDDELGYWGNAAHLAGLNWSSALSFSFYYSYGYSLFLVPLFWLVPAQWLYQSAIVLNCLFVVGSFLLNYATLSKLFAQLNRLLLMGISFCLCLYPAYIFQSYIAWSEAAILFILSALFFFVVRLFEKPNIFHASVVAFLSFFLYMIHQRNLGILVAVAFMVIFLTFRKTLKRKEFFSFFLVLAVCIVVHSEIKYNLIEPLYAGNTTNDYVSILANLRTHLNLRGLLLFLQELSGQLFYLGYATFLLFPLGLMKSALETYHIVKDMRAKRELSPLQFLYPLLLISAIATICISSLSMLDIARMDHAIYGRYNEPLVLLTASVGFIFLLEKTKGTRYSFLASWGLLLITGIVTYLRFRVYPFTSGFNMANVVSVYPFRVGPYTISNALIFALIVSLVVAVYLSRPKRRVLRTVIAVAAFSLFFAITGVRAVNMIIVDAQNTNTKLSEITDIVKGQDSPAYFRATTVFNNNRLRGFFQFLMPTQPLRCVHLEDIGADGEKFILQSTYGPIPFFDNQAIDLIKVVSNGCLYKIPGTKSSADASTEVHIDPSCFFSQNSQTETGGLVSSGEPGYLAFGPSITVPEGSYRLTADVSLLNAVAGEAGTLDVAINGGVSIQQVPLTGAQLQEGGNSSVSLNFSFPAETESVEFRLYTNEGTILQLNGMTVQKLSDQYEENFNLAGFGTQNGQASGDSMTSNGLAGYLLYGNYTPLPVGSYEASWNLALAYAPDNLPADESLAKVDVVAKQSSVTLASRDLPAADLSAAPAAIRLSFGLKEDQSDVE
ncbi:MAG: hypothetical protein FWC60_00140, partial [Firmicutes bacterium]|nr:hypothetical protein [Bacillota bacterium]